MRRGALYHAMDGIDAGEHVVAARGIVDGVGGGLQVGKSKKERKKSTGFCGKALGKKCRRFNFPNAKDCQDHSD